MIDLHERLSEFSYGYGVSREVEGLLEDIGLRATPFLPSLLHEKQLGFDIGFKDRGRVVILQFKLGEELRRFHRTDPSQSIPLLDRPFWRYRVDTTGHQFMRLEEFENARADVYYVAPRFSDWSEYEVAFQAKKVLENSLLLKPSEITRGIVSTGGAPGTHRIAYDYGRRYVCSEPAPLNEIRAAQFAGEVEAKIRQDETTLESHLERLAFRETTHDGPGTLAAVRANPLFERAKSRVNALAAMVGIEAWSQGAQVIFVTDKVKV
jgi:hypothetical protein